MTFWKYMEYRAMEGALLIGIVFFVLILAALMAVAWDIWKKHHGKGS